MRRILLLLPLVVLLGCGPIDRGERLTVFAAASLTGPFTDLGGATFNFAGSSALATQIGNGAPADVFASADETTLQRLVDAGLLERPVVFATNALAIAVAEGNPEGITGLGDLARDDLVVVLCDPAVPAGAYARRALASAGVVVEPASFELDVKAALAKVTSGDADAAIVYETDTGSRVTIPAAQNVEARYPVAVVRGTGHEDAARRFVAELLSRRGREVLERHGFGTP